MSTDHIAPRTNSTSTASHDPIATAVRLAVETACWSTGPGRPESPARCRGRTLGHPEAHPTTSRSGVSRRSTRTTSGVESSWLTAAQMELRTWVALTKNIICSGRAVSNPR